MGRRKDDPWEPTHFWKMLRRWREEKMYTQEELARRAGLSVSTISKLEAGLQEPAWPEVIDLADALGCRVDDFVLPAGEEPGQPEKRPRGRPRTSK